MLCQPSALVASSGTKIDREVWNSWSPERCISTGWNIKCAEAVESVFKSFVCFDFNYNTNKCVQLFSFFGKPLLLTSLFNLDKYVFDA